VGFRAGATRRTLAVVLAAAAVGLADPTSAQPAATGADDVQAHLARLGYLPSNAGPGIGAERTRNAILAFQSWEGLARTGVAGPVTLARLAEASRPTPLRGSGTRIEVHIDRQVALLVEGRAVVRTIHVSTGTAATPTPLGSFHVYRQERESWSVPFRTWLPWASYFNRGVAFHGYPEVPAYRASHGCVRIPLTEAPTVYGFARVGVLVLVAS